MSDVSGLYKLEDGELRLDLRVDIDGVRPTRRISGDLFRAAGATVTYYGSFVVAAPQITSSDDEVTITGVGTFSFNTPAPFVTVRIASSVANVTFSSGEHADGGTPLTCAFKQRAFRTVQWEQDSIEGTTPFSEYDTALLSPDQPSRKLTIPRAYEEAGIAVEVAGQSNIFPIPEGVGATWSNAELHASMVEQFSLWNDQEGWRVWLLVATRHDKNTVRGIMFDQVGRQRQGCAVFHDLVSGDTNEAHRAALRTYVHELGHCFNLLHSWEKTLANPPVPKRLDALSWMNYVQNYPGGADAYWKAFPFQFDDPELVHLRHGFRNNVIMGGSDFF